MEPKSEKRNKEPKGTRIQTSGREFGDQTDNVHRKFLEPMNDPQSKLFDLMSKSHGLALTADELAEIQRVVREIDKTAMMIIELSRLRAVVKKGKLMRDAQKEYFKRRDSLVLRLSKKLEEEFDKGIVEIMPEEVEKKQQTLF